MRLIAEVTIPNYVREVMIAKARNPTYYKQGEKIPLKYQKAVAEKKMFWVQNAKKKAVLLSHPDGTPVIKNIKTAGSPRFLPIRGNDLHRLIIKDYQRSKIIKAIKEQMVPYVEVLNPIPQEEYPLRILMEIHTTPYDPIGKTEDWDLDNHGLWYAKAFPDVLCGCPYAIAAEKDKNGKIVKKGYINYESKRIIVDDSQKVIIQPPTPLFKPIENYEDRKLVFKIYSANG